MWFVGILSLAAMALTGVVVAFRLIALARRSGEQPEQLMGVGLLLVAVLGGPIAAIGRAPGLVATPLGDGMLCVGLAATQVGIALFAAFTCRVFRGDALWATSLLVVIAGVLGAEWLGLITASARGRTMAEILPHTRPWGIAIVATLAVVFGWTGVESFAYYAKLRRRLAIGLADPVVANRLLLWAVAGFAIVVLCTVIAASMLAGLAPLRHALPLAAIGAAAVVASVCWTLAFLPPASYLAALRRRRPTPAVVSPRCRRSRRQRVGARPCSAGERGEARSGHRLGCRAGASRPPAVSIANIAGSPLGYCFKRDS